MEAHNAIPGEHAGGFDRKLQIREAALAIVERGGIGRLTMRALGDEIGLTAGAIYSYYWNRNALLADLHDTITARLLHKLEADTGSVDRAGAALSFMERFMTWALGNPVLFDFLHGYSGPSAADPKGASTQLLNAIQKRVVLGGIARREARTRALAVWSAAEGMLALHRANRFDIAADEFPGVYMRSIELLLTGPFESLPGRRHGGSVQSTISR